MRREASQRRNANIVAEIVAALRRPDVRLLTLTGPGGVGKTRLAIRVAGVMRRELDDGAGFISLAAVRDPAMVVPSIASSLGLPEGNARTLLGRVCACLGERRCLLVLDNFEQVVDAAPVLMQEHREVSEAYQVSATPSAVVVRPDGRVASPVVVGPENIGNLVREVAERAAAAPSTQDAPAVSIGDPAPAFALPSLTGEPVSLDVFRGATVLTMFWRPGCGFCQRMLPELRAWLEHRSADDPAVVLISSESVEANRAMDLDVPILLDEGFATGRAFGARGTPSAVLIAGDGTVQSPVTVGAPAIRQLLGSATEAPSLVATG